ncbi:isotrichodermin C-15 hydroxylase [Whalleya microplaca]|nr:isotrichodermin C-15 hydroxylase [Whalleya microplaca]
MYVTTGTHANRFLSHRIITDPFRSFCKMAWNGLSLPAHPVDVAASTWLCFIFLLVCLYTTTRITYLVRFHPASKFPGPRLAAVSNVWYAYHWIRGRWPWAVEQALREYGDIVRIAPNELAFMTPQSVIDIHGSAVKHQEVFVKTEFVDLGSGDGGIAWERDPHKHREIAKKLSPAFSLKSIHAKEIKFYKYIDIFIDKIKANGGSPAGIEISKWTTWMAMDLSADVVYSRKTGHMNNEKSSDLLDSLLDLSFFATINQVSRRFPWLRTFRYLFIPPRVLRTLPKALKANDHEIQARIGRQGMDNIDYFEHIFPPDAPPPDSKTAKHLGQLAFQLLIAGFEPTSTRFYTMLFILSREREAYNTLVREVRSAFPSYDDIELTALSNMSYLNACIWETFRLFNSIISGHPRLSPGAMVDGVYIPKGVVCQICPFATCRSPRYFYDPLRYCPQRWLPREHPGYDQKFANDNLKSFFPFGYGPRQCIGRESAWPQMRLFLAKILWTFDLEAVDGQDLVFDRDFSMYAMWNKPKLRIRFVPVPSRR